MLPCHLGMKQLNPLADGHQLLLGELAAPLGLLQGLHHLLHLRRQEGAPALRDRQLLLQVLLAVDGLIQTNLSVLSGEGGRWWASCALCLAVLSLYWNPGSKEFEHLDPAEDKAVLVNAMAVQLVAHLVLRLDVPELLGGVRRLEVGVA